MDTLGASPALTPIKVHRWEVMPAASINLSSLVSGMNKKFWEVAREILVKKKQRSISDVANKLGMEYATLYSRLNGRTPFRLEEASALLIELPDARLADAILKETHFIAVPRLDEPGWGRSGDAIVSALRTVQELLEVLTDINIATSSSQIEKADRIHIESHVYEAERSLARLRLAIPHLSVMPKPIKA
ncbi:MAG: phage regulatory CII family protein [Rhizomicrobium sp.]